MQAGGEGGSRVAGRERRSLGCRHEDLGVHCSVYLSLFYCNTTNEKVDYLILSVYSVYCLYWIVISISLTRASLRLLFGKACLFFLFHFIFT